MIRFERRCYITWFLCAAIEVVFALDPRYQHWSMATAYFWPAITALWVRTALTKHRTIRARDIELALREHLSRNR